MSTDVCDTCGVSILGVVIEKGGEDGRARTFHATCTPAEMEGLRALKSSELEDAFREMRERGEIDRRQEAGMRAALALLVGPMKTAKSKRQKAVGPELEQPKAVATLGVPVLGVPDARQGKMAPRSRAKARKVPTEAAGSARWVVRWLNSHGHAKAKGPYLYQREYLGTEGHSRPRYRDVYIGKVSADVAERLDDAELATVAAKLQAEKAG
jgi:hypothetical protein